MDKFMNLAKQGYSAYQDSQGKKDEDVKTGGQDYNQRPPSPPGAGYGTSGGQSYNQGPPSAPGAGYGGSGGQDYNQGPQSTSGPGYGGSGSQDYNQGPPSGPGASYGSAGGQSYNQGPPSGPGAGSGGSGGQDYNQGPQSTSGAGYGKTGGQEYNQRAPSPDGPDFSDDDDKIAARASDHAGNAGDASLFSQALSFAKGNKAQHKEPVDEAYAVDSHKVAYDQDKPSNLDASALGSAAALQTLKNFTSSGGSGGSGGGSQNQLIAMAMSEAAKLFDKGGAKSGDKQDAVNGAAMTVVKLMVQSKFGGGSTGDTNKPDFSSFLGGGGGGGGGSNQLLGLASSYFGKK